MFKKATRSQVFIKLAITGPTGSGKTFSALRLANGLIEGTGKRIAFLDTENGSASLYADRFDFDAVDIPPPYESEKFIDAIKAAVAGDYGVIIIDSASHLWKGVLEYKDKLDSRAGTNSFSNWKDADRKFDPAIAALLQSKIHVIVCMRSKMDYVLEQNEKGKQAPRKVGMAPVMRDGIEYEFTTVFDIALNHEAQTSKDRSGLFTDKIFQITEETGKQIAGWLSTAKQAGFEGAVWHGVTVTNYRNVPEPEKQRTWHLFEFSNEFRAHTLSAEVADKVRACGESPMDIKTRPVGEKFEIMGVEYIQQ